MLIIIITIHFIVSTNLKWIHIDLNCRMQLIKYIVASKTTIIRQSKHQGHRGYDLIFYVDDFLMMV